MSVIDCTKSVTEYVSKEDWRVNSNANVVYSHGGLINNIAGKVIANYWLDEVYSEEESTAHRNGDYHIHDLDCLSGYCAGWSLRQLLVEGFNGIPGKTSSKAPKHLREALGQAANFLGVLQSEWGGAQSFSSFDTYLAPYLFKDQLTNKELKKALRQFVYNLNVTSRYSQTPFTNVTFDIVVPDDIKVQQPMRGGEHLFAGLHDTASLLSKMKERNPDITDLTQVTYADFVPEMERIVITFYDILTEGDSVGQPFTFPIPTVNITENFNWESRVADAIFANAAQVGSSYFQNFIGSQYMLDEEGNKVDNPDAYKPGAVRSMCCRLQLNLTELLKRGNGLFGSAEMTGSIGVVTLNMARLGHTCCGDEAKLCAEVDKLCDYAKSTLEKKRAAISNFLQQGFYPYTLRYLKTFKNHFSTIGVCGMNEMLLNFTRGRHDIASAEGVEFSMRVLNRMRDRLKMYQEETGHLYNVEATPAEGTTYRFAKEDLKRFPTITQAGAYPNIYYTNSSQLPVGYTDDPFEALSLQDSLQTRYTGGTVLHMYMGEQLGSAASCRAFVKSILTNYRLPYITMTPVFSVCPTHNRLSGLHDTCPHCGTKTTQFSRVMGYYRPVDGFNVGKQGEHKERKFFTQKQAEIHIKSETTDEHA